MSGPRIALLGVWLLLAAAFLVGGDSTLAYYARIGFWVMAGVHVLECLVFLPLLRRAPGSLGGHLANTLVFGVLHVRELREAEAGTG